MKMVGFKDYIVHKLPNNRVDFQEIKIRIEIIFQCKMVINSPNKTDQMLR